MRHLTLPSGTMKRQAQINRNWRGAAVVDAFAVLSEIITGGLLLFSGADRDRTGDPLLAKQVLSQLSYRPEGTTRLQASGFCRPPQVGVYIRAVITEARQG
jgi:hypothetical protein